MGIDRSTIVSFLNEFLDIASVRDTSWNGLQIEGSAQVQRIAFAVDAGEETFALAAEHKADFLLVHHGLFWAGANPSLVGYQRQRIDILLNHHISLYACHLPLDRHRTVGNNAQLLKILRARITGEFAHHQGQPIGWVGTLSKPTSASLLARRLTRALGTSVRLIASDRPMVKTIGVCSGGGGYSTFSEAVDRNLDLYVTGDAIEIYHTARDARINVIFAGHHATETTGVKALAAVVGRKYPVEAEFIDVPTGL